VIAVGTTDVRGVGGDYAEVLYDGDMVSELLRQMGQYRHTKTIFELGDDPSPLAGGE
jgi:hypothetical protein